MLRRAVIFLLFCLAALAPCVEAASVVASLDRESLMVGESTGLKLKFDQRPDRMPVFQQIPGLDVQFTGQGNQITIVNGQQDVSFSLNYVITPSKEGTYTIPSIKASVGGTTVKTEPLQLTVTKTEEGASNRYAFLKLNVPKKEVYVGEVMPIEVQLYVVQGENLQEPTLASEGFVINKKAQHTQAQTQVGNQIYHVISFKMAVSAAKEGDLTFGPAVTKLTLLLPQQNRGGDFFPDFFPRYARRPTELKSDSYKIRVLALPPNPPAGFSGAVGNFTLNADASPRSLSAGDPITLKITIAGRGNLDNLKLPDFNWPNFKFYPPNSSVASNDPLGMQGSKSFEQVVSPENSSVKEIPALQFAFFDPAQKAYRSIQKPAISLEVKPGTNQPVQTPIAGKTGEQPAPARDIVHIKNDMGQLGAISPPLISQRWFLALQSVPLLALVSAAFWRKRRDTLANNPRLRRKLQVRKTVANGLAELKRHASENNSDEFFATVFRLLQEQLGERLDLPASAITEAVLDEDLPQKQASPELVAQLHSLFQLCNQARYAPIRTSAELNAIVPRVESALSQLQQLPD